ncbi:hypothetical protein Purlil1_8306 [Purpureocillium lilacinum]|uniref:Uncharacterized protein n=1 Tax=Purpureocillium lilacinum TaxID=33203 RepID=A0ABR0BUU6_PURLI|nr:hypothetical protein Purlil1_8306 [Purpureocillium lilacinum]
MAPQTDSQRRKDSDVASKSPAPFQQNRAASTWKPLLPLSELSPPRNGGCKATRPAFFGDLVRRLDVYTTSTYEAQEFRRGMALSPFMTLGGTRLIQRLTSRSTDRTRRDPKAANAGHACLNAIGKDQTPGSHATPHARSASGAPRNKTLTDNPPSRASRVSRTSPHEPVHPGEWDASVTVRPRLGRTQLTDSPTPVPGGRHLGELARDTHMPIALLLPTLPHPQSRGLPPRRLPLAHARAHVHGTYMCTKLVYAAYIPNRPLRLTAERDNGGRTPPPTLRPSLPDLRLAAVAIVFCTPHTHQFVRSHSPLWGRAERGMAGRAGEGRGFRARRGGGLGWPASTGFGSFPFMFPSPETGE